VPACCSIQTKADFDRFGFILGVIWIFDRKMLDILKKKNQLLTLLELGKDSWFAFQLSSSIWSGLAYSHIHSIFPDLFYRSTFSIRQGDVCC